jgi:H+/Cl- antiporter ClcA
MALEGGHTAGSEQLEAAVGGEANAVSPAHPVHPYVHVVVVAFLGALVVLAWLVVFEKGMQLLWDNDLVTANPWLFPVICLPFSLLAGILVKRWKAPTTLDESMLDSLSGHAVEVDWRKLPLTVVMAWVSLFSGAVLGPEGGIGGIATKIAAFYSEKVGIPAEHRQRLMFSTLASSYNGLIANPLFTGVLGTELIKDEKAKSQTLPANLIGGSIGFLLFTAVGSTGFQDFLHLTTTQPYVPLDMVYVVVFGLIGLVMAVLAGVLFKVADAAFGRLKDRPIERALLAGLIFSAIGMFAPIVLFSGETQVAQVAASAASYGPLVLLGMAFAKLALLAIAFKSGFLGGPTFPAIFASVCVASAIGLLFPGVRIDVIVGGVMGGFLVVFFRAPFMVILLTAVMLGATPELTALVILAVAAAMIAQPYIVSAVQTRAAARMARRRGGSAA